MNRILFASAIMLACVTEIRADGCFIATAPSMDRIPDISGVPRVNIKGRFLPILDQNVGRASAIQVEFVSLPAPYNIWNGAKMFARAAIDICETHVITTGECSVDTYTTSKLECTTNPLYTDWNALGVVNVWHEGIVPGGTYIVRVIDETCDPSIPANFSEPTEMPTAIYGETVGATGYQHPADNVVDIIDVLAVIAVFGNFPNKPSKSRTDIGEQCMNHMSNAADFLAAIAGFQGIRNFRSPSTTNPCNSSCPEP